MVGDNCIKQDLVMVDVYAGNRWMFRLHRYKSVQEIEKK